MHGYREETEARQAPVRSPPWRDVDLYAAARAWILEHEGARARRALAEDDVGARRCRPGRWSETPREPRTAAPPITSRTVMDEHASAAG